MENQPISQATDNIMKEFAFEYYSHDQELRVTIKAKSMNEAMIKFAKSYHNIDRVHSIEEVVSLYKYPFL